MPVTDERLDAELARARAALLTDAVLSGATEEALTTVRRSTPTRRRRGGRRGQIHVPERRTVARAAAAITAVGLVGVAVALVVLRLWADDDQLPAAPPPTANPSTTTPPVTTASAAPTTTAPPSTPTTPTTPGMTPGTTPGTTAAPTTSVDLGTVVPLTIGTLSSTSWIDAEHGTVTEAATGGATSTWVTSDGGRTWTALDVPADTIGVRFATTEDGWAMTATTWWSTHDGGATWTDTGIGVAQTAFLPVLSSIATSDQLVVIVELTEIEGTYGLRVRTSPVDHDDFTDGGVRLQFGAGPALDLSVAVRGEQWWVVVNNRTYVDSAHGTGAVAAPSWTPPHADEFGPVTISVAAEGPLWSHATTGVWGGDMDAEQFVEWSDDGQSWTEATAPQPSGFGSVTPIDRETALMTVAAADGTVTVLRTDDRGQHWAPTSAPAQTQFVDVVDGSTIVVTVRDDTREHVWRSTDGGATWAPIVLSSGGR